MRNDILKYIEKFKKSKGYTPSQSEIARGLGVDRRNVHYHFKSMGGELKKYPEYARFFRLTMSKIGL